MFSRKIIIFIVSWIKKHRLLFCVCISALMQLGVLYFYFMARDAEIQEKDFLPISALPYSERPPQENINKPLEEPKPEDLSDSDSANNNNSQNQGGEPSSYYSFVKVDDVAKPTSSLMPSYPEMAKTAGIEGSVVIEAYIDEAGRVRKVNVIKGLGFGCEEAAVQRVRSTLFVPAKINGKPVAVRQMITFEFRLR